MKQPIEIAWHGTFSGGQGYSGSSEQTALAIDRLPEFELYVVPFNVQQYIPLGNVSKEGQALLSKPQGHADIGVCHAFPGDFHLIQSYPYRVGFTMFETDTMPKGYSDWTGKYPTAAKSINSQLDLLLTPSQFCVEMFRENGVTVPIEVMHNGVHPKAFPYIERKERKKFTFMIMGTLTLRKNSGAVISAFMDEFKGQDDVTLIVKTQSGTHGNLEFAKELGDIRIIDAPYSEAQMYELMANSDCFVFPSRGEGFGMPPLEAMATGMDCIMADNTGMRELMDPRHRFSLTVKSAGKSKALKYPPKWGPVGNWVESDYEDLKRCMRFAYDHREYRRSLAKERSRWAHKAFSYQHVAEQFANAIAKHYPQ